MKLIECYIENFGRISKKKISFKDGVNCIKDDNGSGKSTLAAYIKVMLYGMSDTKKSSLEENDRRHYMPWGGGVCGGSLTFSARQKTYRIERTFAPKAADDSFAIYDTATGKLCNDFPDGVGESLFGIDADGFERTVFLSERALTPKSDNKSISAKLSDLVGCDGDIGAMDDAMKLLDERRKFYYKKGGSGELADIKAEIDNITRRLDSLVEIDRAAEESFAKMRELKQNIETAREEAKIIFASREAAVVRAAEVNHEKQYKEMKAALEASVNRRVAVAEIFGADIPTHEEINEASYKSTEAKALMQNATDTPEIREFNSLSAKFDGKVQREQIEEARAAISELKKIKEKEADPRLNKAKKIFSGRVPSRDEIESIGKTISRKKIKANGGIIAGIIISILAAIVGIFTLPILIPIGAVGVVVCLIVNFTARTKWAKERRNKIESFFSSVSGVKVESDEEADARLTDMRDLIDVMKDGDSGASSDELTEKLVKLVVLFPDSIYEHPVTAAERIIGEYDKYTELALAERYMSGDRAAKAERAARLNLEVETFISRFRARGADPFTELRVALTEYERLTADIVAKRDAMANLESLYTMGEGKQKMALAEIGDLDRQRAENDGLIARLSNEFALTERNYRNYLDMLEGKDELAMRKAELEAELQKQQDNYDIVVLTKKYITQAKDNMTVKYLGKTKSGFIKYAEKISGITGESFEMDTDFGVAKQEGASTKTVEAYSRGTRDLYNLASRLALVDSLYDKEKPFIILDDPFTAFDDSKTRAALKLLSEFGKERQIIYFTCAESRSI